MPSPTKAAAAEGGAAALAQQPAQWSPWSPELVERSRRSVGGTVAAARAALGYAPENPYFYEYLTARETLDFYARLFGLGRLERLRSRARRSGARVEVHGPAAPAGLLVDRALVDAPCSELGTLRRGPDLRFRIDPSGFAALPALQLSILIHPGGTCRRRSNGRTFSTNEDGPQTKHSVSGSGTSARR